MCGSAIRHDVQFSTNDQWHVGQEIRHLVFQESFVIPPCKPVLMYGNRLRELRKSVYHSAVLASLNSETMHFRTYVDINYFYYLHMRNPFLKLCRIFLKHPVYVQHVNCEFLNIINNKLYAQYVALNIYL
jgi:hypothetical protein